MKRTFLSLAAAALALAPAGLMAQATTTTTQDQPNRTRDGAARQERMLTDAEFIQRAAVDGLMETTLAGMVDDQTDDDEALEKYAEQIDSDHDKANRDLVTLAEKKGIDVPNTLDDRRKQMIDQMGELKGQAFAQRYIRQQVLAHQRAVRLFAAEAENGKDEDIRAFAQKNVPILRQHLKMAQDLASARNIEIPVRRGGGGGTVEAPAGTTTATEARDPGAATTTKDATPAPAPRQP